MRTTHTTEIYIFKKKEKFTFIYLYIIILTLTHKLRNIFLNIYNLMKTKNIHKFNRYIDKNENLFMIDDNLQISLHNFYRKRKIYSIYYKW